MDGFRYNEESREHTLDGLPCPSVTQIINPLSDFSMIPSAVLERKCELGIQFHKAIELYMDDDLVMDSLDPDIIKPMETFIEWERSGNFSGAKLEKVLFNPELKYCGKADMVTPDTIIDFKLRKYNPVTDPLQMAGYAKCIEEGYTDITSVKMRKTVLCFDIKGKLKVHDASNRQAWNMFVTMLGRWKSELKFNKTLESWKGNN